MHKFIDEGNSREIIQAEFNKLLTENDSSAFEAWWVVAKFAVCLVLLTTVIGSFYCVLTANVITAVKYPDFWLRTVGKMEFRDNCPTGYGKISKYHYTLFS